MKKELVTTQVVELWQPSVKLRYLKQENHLILQQLYISNLSNELWQDVEIINETKTNKVY